jgi:RNA polymerase sigma-70 factor (ECF subfamily)
MTPTVFARDRTLAEDAAAVAEVARLVKRAQCGDRDALGALYSRYSGNVYGYVRSIVTDDHEAEDVTQQVFAKLLTAVRAYRPRTAPFVSWLLRIAHNVAIDHIRGRRAPVLPAAPDRPVDEPGYGRRDLHDALDRLPVEQRRVVLLRHVVGLSPVEIARHLGKTEHAVNGLHHRGRRALQAELVIMGRAPATMAA